MSYKLLFSTISKANVLLDFNIQDNLDKQHEYRKEMILKDNSLTMIEKSQVINSLNKYHDYNKIIFNEGTRRICENCREECLATLYCEFCIKNFLQSKFSSWTSKNDNIDNLLQECQMKSIGPNRIIEWIPYDNLQNVKYLSEGIYSADWVGGYYVKWDSNEQQLKRSKTKKVILKRLEKLENANKNWFEKAKSYLTTSIKWNFLVKYYGLTKDQLNGGYMLVMKELNTNLRNYLQDRKQLTWNERIKITEDIIWGLFRIHKENIVHGNLHSRNILFSYHWQIGDIGFCGPADKPLGNIYGTLSYMAPEAMAGKEYTFASDIYSLSMIMWEISSGHPPFINYEHDDYNFVINIINGMRPEIVPGTPLEYKELMEQCWNDDPMKRPNINMLLSKISEMNKAQQTNNSTYVSSINISAKRNFISKIYNIMDLHEPRNIIEALPNVQPDLSISNNIISVEEQYDSPMLIDGNDDKPKRIYIEILDDSEDDDVIVIKHKKMKK